MKKILITILGKGQAKFLDQVRAEYRQAFYFRSDVPEKGTVSTPFIGEALIKLYEDEAFDKIYIIGTNDSMWDLLYWHCCRVNPQPEDIITRQKISEEVETRSVSEQSLNIVEKKFQSYLSVEANCLVVDVGRDIHEIRSIFNRIISLPGQNDQVTLDITHGLRFHPFLLILATLYLKHVKDVSIKAITYGALELSSEFPVMDNAGKKVIEKTPVIDLKSMVDYVDWIQAANAFKSYGDISELSGLLGDLSSLKDSADELSLALQLNLTGKIKSKAESFLTVLNEPKELSEKLKPLELISPVLKIFPERISQQNSDWQVMLMLARRNFERQFGLSILAAWEAAISRMAEAFQVAQIDFDHHRALAQILRHPITNRVFSGTVLEDFHEKMRDISTWRNAIAHAEESVPFDVLDVKNEFEKILSFMEDNLGSPLFEELPSNGVVLRIQPT